MYIHTLKIKIESHGGWVSQPHCYMHCVNTGTNMVDAILLHGTRQHDARNMDLLLYGIGQSYKRLTVIYRDLLYCMRQGVALLIADLLYETCRMRRDLM